MTSSLLEKQITELGLCGYRQIFSNLSVGRLYEEAIKRNEGQLGADGQLVVETGVHTGRAAQDKRVVKDELTASSVNWGADNQPITAQQFEQVFARAKRFVVGKDLFVCDCYVGAAASARFPVRVITQKAWHNLFADNMFVRAPGKSSLAEFVPEFTVIDMPDCLADPQADGTNETFVLINFTRRLVLIGGTYYGGEIKKSIFTIMNYLLPPRGILPMHCSANVGDSGDVALFFGLSGTGKTTLSADQDRPLIGDDEHAWGDDGVFNFEGGCYAKVIGLSAAAEPEIYQVSHCFGTILENVACDPASREIDLDDSLLTENTRASYRLNKLPHIVASGQGGHPKNIIMLTCDAFGVLPPLARLSEEQALYHFLSGYTAKVAGTEAGILEPTATFSACFGAPFMPRAPTEYALLLQKYIAKYNVRCWLVNTGWQGGPYGVGQRISIAYTRAIIQAILSGALEQEAFVADRAFGLLVPKCCPGVPSELLLPENAWQGGGYQAQAQDLIARFVANFRQYSAGVGAAVAASFPASASGV